MDDKTMRKIIADCLYEFMVEADDISHFVEVSQIAGKLVTYAESEGINSADLRDAIKFLSNLIDRADMHIKN